MGPAGVVAGLIDSLMAVGLAFASYGAKRASHPQVRARVSPWPASDRDPARTCWVTIARWQEKRRGA
ncbi:MAG: hypothetical protein CSA65_08595 [Proteobacteria bacterium]|nr:MAG: hypothetical protein CSB49_06985 [Pseudomonadota bacterium]PIE17545.1 MAG: hypothetical protein CSA65_08595 [Pseudomonadota bacterium]